MNKYASAVICIVSCVFISNGARAQGAQSSVSAPVSATSKASDRAMAKSVRRALGRIKGLDPTRVYVRALGGIVTLSGTVRDQAQIDLAEKTAGSVKAVSSVSNKMTLFNEGGN